MKSPASPAARFAAWAQACGLAFIIGGLVLAEGAAAWNFAAKLIAGPSAGILLAAGLVYLLAAGAGLAGLHGLWKRCGHGPFLWTALGVSLLIQWGAILAADSKWEWTGDSRIFQSYLTALSETGYAQATLEQLSPNYDYRVWTKRALPFYYALRVASGDRFVLAAQVFQALLIALSLALADRIARRLFNRRVAFWAVSLQLLMPFRWFICLDLNHHVLGGFYFLAGLWILVEWLRPDRRPLRAWSLAIGAAVLLPLMRLEGGIDTVFAGATLLVLLLAWAAGRLDAPQTLRSAAALLALPMLAAALLVTPLAHRIDRADRHRLESGAIAFMARGWAPETGGEYCNVYETIDVLTSPADKKTVQAAILASQAFYNPRALAGRLLPTKIAKFFLLGYASGAEEMLAHNGARRAAALAEGARTAFLLAVLPLMAWGGGLLLPLLCRTRRLPVVLPCSILCATYVLLGETSPRYSFYVQPFLFMLAALPLAGSPLRRRRLLRAARRPGLVAAGSLGCAFLLAAGSLAAARPALGRHALRDLRTWSGPADAKILPATLAPFEIQLSPRVESGGTTWGTIRIPALSPPPRFLSFYAIPDGAPSGFLRGATLLATSGTRTQTNSLPGRIRMEYPPSGLGEVEFRSPARLPFPLRIGYATYEFHEKTTD